MRKRKRGSGSQLNIRVSQELRERVREVAKRERRKFSDMARILIEDGLGQREPLAIESTNT